MVANNSRNISIVVSYRDQTAKTTFSHFKLDATDENILTIAEKIAGLKKFTPTKYLKVVEGLLVE